MSKTLTRTEIRLIDAFRQLHPRAKNTIVRVVEAILEATTRRKAAR